MIAQTTPAFQWKPEYSVGVPELDAQHRHLVALINELGDAVSRGSDDALMRNVFDRLIHYVQNHFAAEERFMQAAGYPGFAEHVEEHHVLTRQVYEMYKRYLAGDQADPEIHPEAMLASLTRWLTHHILESDKGYQPYLAS